MKTEGGNVIQYRRSIHKLMDILFILEIKKEGGHDMQYRYANA